MMRAALLALGAVLAAGPLRADLPQASCFVLPPEARAAGVERLALRILPSGGSAPQHLTDWRYAELTVVLGPSRPEVAGKRLTQALNCRAGRMACAAANGTGWVEIEAPAPDRLVLRTLDLPVGDYGESDLESNLANPPGTETVLRLQRVPYADCEAP